MYKALKIDTKNIANQMSIIRAEMEDQTLEDVKRMYRKDALQELLTLLKALLLGIDKSRAKEIVFDLEKYFLTEAEIAERKKKNKD